MAVTKEGLVKRQVKKILDAHNVYYFMPATGGYGKAGVADIIACFKSKFLAIECKTVSGKVTALQQKNIDAVRAHGGCALVINEDNMVILEMILKEMEN